MTSIPDAPPLGEPAIAERTTTAATSVGCHPKRRTRILLSSPSWLGGGLLFACMFLPLAKGCGDSNIYPYHFILTDPHSAAAFLDGLWIVIPYVFGGVTAAGVFAAAILGDWRIHKWWWRAYVVTASVLAVAYWAAIGAEARASELPLSENIWPRWLAIISSIILPLVSWLSYRNGRTWIVKTAFLQLVFAVSGLAWFLYLLVSLEFGLLYGGLLSIVACWLLVGGAIVQWATRKSACFVDS